MSKDKLKNTVLSLIIIIVVTILSTCQPPPSREETTAEPPTEEVSTKAPAEEETDVAQTEEAKSIVAVPVFDIPTYVCPEASQERLDSISGDPTDSGYIEGQIMLTGRAEDIARIVTEVNVDLDFDQPFESVQPMSTVDLPPDEVNSVSFSIQLYQLQPRVSVWGLVRDINDFVLNHPINQDDGETIDPRDDLFVVAEPNYITGLPVHASNGGSSGIEGMPGSGPADAILQGKDLFYEQWAFYPRNSNKSINLFNIDGNWTAADSTNNYGGANVKVAVFDTASLPAGQNSIDWSYTPFDLCVWKPGLMFGNSHPLPSRGSITGHIPRQEHGLFVTGLAQGVAPAADYHLIEVLNDEARGDINTLLRGLNYWLSPYRDTVGLQNTVINLSLGLALENDPNVTAEPEEVAALAALKNLLDMSTLPYKDELVTTAYPAFALKVATVNFEQEGAIFVAAAGNEDQSKPQVPAGYSNVIGVASNNVSGNKSCFSNTGNLAAPGGEGFDLSLTPCSVDTIAACPSSETSLCDTTVMSIVSPGSSLSQYAHWVGTSFSTPQVSGLAALILEAQPGLFPAGVRNIILCSAGFTSSTSLPTPSPSNPLGAGIINVERAFNGGCLLPP